MTENLYDTPKSDVLKNNDELVALSWMEILFSFQGRIPRKTYWLAMLGCTLAMIIIMVLPTLFLAGEAVFGILMLLLYIPLIWVSLAIAVKRWHDRDKSGWWMLISLIPVIGPIWAFVENGFLPGTEGGNSYGPPSA